MLRFAGFLVAALLVAACDDAPSAMPRPEEAGIANEVASPCGEPCPSAADGGGELPVSPPVGPDAAVSGPGTDDGSTPAGDGGTPKKDPRPEGVALCYSDFSSEHEASQAFWRVLRSGDLAGRAAVIEALTDASEAHPEEEEFFLLLGLAQLWRVAEPQGLEALDLGGLLEAVSASEAALERAYEICPTDHRIPAWLGPIKVRSGRNSGDQALVEEGFAVLEQGVKHYPGFVLFSEFLVYADLPADDPDFLLAVEAVRENTEYCGGVDTGLSDDPACRNHFRAAHNVEGAMVFMGDMYAKAQDRDAALASYENARLSADWDEWDYQALLQERIDTLDARMAGHASAANPFDDHQSAWEADNQCSICHRE